MKVGDNWKSMERELLRRGGEARKVHNSGEREWSHAVWPYPIRFNERRKAANKTMRCMLKRVMNVTDAIDID